MGALFGAIVGEAQGGVGQITGFFGGKKSAKRELRRLERDYYAAVGRRQDQLKDTTGKLKSANLVRAAGSGVEVGSITTRAGIPQAQILAERDIREMERQYLARRKQIDDQIDGAKSNLIFTGVVSGLGLLAPSHASQLGSALTDFGVDADVGGKPLTPAQGITAGQAQGIFEQFGGGGKGGGSSAARGGAPSGVDSSEVIRSVPPDTDHGVAATSPALLGTRKTYAWYA